MAYFLNAMESGCNLHESIVEGDLNTTNTLLQIGTLDVNKTDPQGRTALHIAALRGKFNLVKLLISKGADVNANDNHGNTPLHFCGNIDSIEFLVDNGANVLCRNKIGLLPRELAKRRGVSPSVLDLFKHLEADQVPYNSVNSEYLQSRINTSTMGHLRTRSTTPTNNLRQQQLKQASAGLWHELSWELGVRNSLLLLLGLLGLSFYVAYILTGMHRGINIRIPIDGHSDSFKMQI